MDNKCKVNLDATIVNGNGSTSVEKFKAADNPAIDCFFVYPTVSLDPGWASDWIAGLAKSACGTFGSGAWAYAPPAIATARTAPATNPRIIGLSLAELGQPEAN